MNARHLMLPSPAMGRDVHVWCYGWWGSPVVIFPSAAGFAHEWDAQGMLEVLSPLLRSGRIKLYCPESNVSEAWTKKEGTLEHRMARHAAYERFVLDTLVPFVRADVRLSEARIAVAGCSLGATYAALMALKQPEVFDRALCMSGRYLTTVFTEGKMNAEVYFNNPLAFVPRLAGPALDRVRRNTHLTLVCGQGPYEEGCIEETIELADQLASQRVPHIRDIWGRDSRHDWDWWQKHALVHFARMFAG